MSVQSKAVENKISMSGLVPNTTRHGSYLDQRSVNQHEGNTTKDVYVQKHPDYLERSRIAVLSFGYTVIIFKSKTKKSLTLLKKQLSMFNPLTQRL